MAAQRDEKEEYSYRAEMSSHPQELMMLYEFGFTDYLVNLYLLTKHGDVNAVADLLMNGQVSQDSIKAIYEAAAKQK